MSQAESLRNWRMLEHEIVTILERHGFVIYEEKKSGDKLILVNRETPDLNITSFAQELDLRVDVRATVVKIMKEPTP